MNNKIKINLKYDKEEKKLFNEENSESLIYNILKDLFNYLLTKRDYLNDLNKKVGDGDIGTGLYNSVIKVLANLPYLVENPVNSIVLIAIKKTIKSSIKKKNIFFTIYFNSILQLNHFSCM